MRSIRENWEREIMEKQQQVKEILEQRNRNPSQSRRWAAELKK